MTAVRGASNTIRVPPFLLLWVLTRVDLPYGYVGREEEGMRGQDNGTPRVSCTVVLDQLKAARQIVGDDTVDRAVSDLSAEDQQAVQQLTPVGWTDADRVERLYTAIAARAGREPLELHAEMVRQGFWHTLSTFWRAMLRLTTDQALIARTPLIYSRSFDRGEATAQIDRPGLAQMHLKGWPNIPRMHINGIVAGVETVLKVAGRKRPSVSYERTSNGVVFTVTWDTDE